MLQILFIAVGGAVGAVLRYLLYAALGAPSGFPLAILLANVAGSVAIGALYVMINETRVLAQWFQPLLIVGLLGAFTTFSSFSLDTVRLFTSGQILLAIANVGLSVCLALVGASLGIYLARAVSN